jgi:RNA polymerase sigma-70 factor (ECF subfamily)
MAENDGDTADLIQKSLAGDEAALAELFNRYRPRLKRMVSLRMNARVQQRVDASDVLQEAFIDLAQRLPDYAKDPQIEFFLWLRLVTGQRLAMVHRKHVDAKMRDVGMEVSINRGRVPEASTFFLASGLIGQFTSVGQRAIRAEMQSKLQEVLDDIDADDREILALKHFEEMTNSEIGQVLGITESGASKRYIRALRRLRQVARQIPGLFDQSEAE